MARLAIQRCRTFLFTPFIHLVLHLSLLFVGLDNSRTDGLACASNGHCKQPLDAYLKRLGLKSTVC